MNQNTLEREAQGVQSKARGQRKPIPPLEDRFASPQPYPFSWFDWFCLWYPPGWLILFNRHWQHYHADPDGWNALEYALFLIPGGFYVALFIRWVRLGFRAPRRTCDRVSPQYQQAFREEILARIVKNYFRAELCQTEHLPRSGRFLVVINHAGMCFPWDFLSLAVLLTQEREWFVQPVAHEIFFDHPWLRWWLPIGWSETLGGIRAERDSFATAMAQDDPNSVLLYAPEGWRGLAKGWQQRHQLETFDPSFMKLSDRYHVPILPILCEGSEYLHPWAINIKKVAHWLKMPLFPISPLVPFFILFPSMGVWCAKTRLRYHIQPLETPWQQTDSSPQTRSLIYQMAQDLRSRLQKVLERLRP